MDERTTDALREVVEDMAQALQLAAKSGEALILFLEEMLSSLESWAADHNVTLSSKPSIALRSHRHHPLHLSSQIDRSLTEIASPLHQDLDAKQALLEAEHQVALPVLSRCADDVPIDGKSSVGIFCFDAERERARMLAAKKRHDNHMGVFESACEEGQAQMRQVEASRYAKDMHLCEKRAKTSSACSVMECVKEERCEHESMAFVGVARAFDMDPHTDNAVACPDITPAHVCSSLHSHLIGIHAYKSVPDGSMPLQVGKREPFAVEQKGEETGSDWLPEGLSM